MSAGQVDVAQGMSAPEGLGSGEMQRLELVLIALREEEPKGNAITSVSLDPHGQRATSAARA